MGATRFRRDCLQRLILVGGGVAFAFLSFISSASAQVFPIRARLVYSASLGTPPPVQIQSVDGASYQLALSFDLDVANKVVVADLSLRGPRSNRNLLEPSYNWHGLHKFMFGARDFAHGPEHSAYGASRIFILRKEKMRVRVNVAKVGVRSVGNDKLDYSIDELALEIDVSNLR